MFDVNLRGVGSDVQESCAGSIFTCGTEILEDSLRRGGGVRGWRH